MKLDIEFNRIWSKLESAENFALARYGDGERCLMLGQSVTAQEGWRAPDYITKLGLDLLKTLSIKDEKFIHAISCPCCDTEAFYWYTSRLDSSANITFANLFVNKNYQKFISKFAELKRDAVFIGNYRAQDKKIANLNILDYYCVGDDCIKFWEEKGEELLNNIKTKYGTKENLLYIISAGPMSEPIIFDLFKNNPNNTYIDFGSSIDIYIHEKTTRPYQNPKTQYAKQNCVMPVLDETYLSVSAVLTLYKRPEKLMEQIDALENQSLKPREIILFHDAASPQVTLPEDVKDRISNYIRVEKNVGVWGRFAGGLLAKNKYVCFFDDDTIPGDRWLENCHTQMQKKKGLYGTIGIRAWNLRRYPYSGHVRLGWDGGCSNTEEVDFLGHSWFLEKDWLGSMWINSSKFYNFKYVSEDAFLSCSLRKWLGIKSFVPPHPPENLEMYGSLPKKAVLYGQEENSALSMNPEMLERMNKALNLLADNGMKPVMPTWKKFLYKASRAITKKCSTFIPKRIKRLLKSKF